MISGTPSPISSLLLLLACGATSASASGDPERLSAFLAGLAPPTEDLITFVEKRMSSLLVEPLELRGELRLGKDGAIDKHVLYPVEERVQITAETLTLLRDGKTRTLDLGGDARWRAFYAGIVGLLNRDLPALDKAFIVHLEETPGGWTLQLRPRISGGKNMIRMITASGEGARLLRLRLEQAESEWQEMIFTRTGS